MSTPPVDAPPRPPVPRSAVRATVLLSLCSLVLLVLVAVGWEPLMSVDGAVARTTHRWAVDEPGLTHTFRILSDWVWDPNTMRLLGAAVAVWLVWRRGAWWTACWLVAVSALGTLVQQGLKAAVGRPRPWWPDPVDTAHFAAYPSGHALTATVVCGLLLWLLHRAGPPAALWRTAVALAVVSVAGVGLTRVWLGVHWPSDVLGGWLLGAALVAAAIIAHRRWRPVRPARR
ncbi:phosphatase PAP2 family protein [Streptomyces longwoodensis]|uniref:phosphatase PAP2 family protein n=1 Tax=Streptomyces longwoodensis TaxID=68231 RepID=UPI0033D180EA